MTAGRTACYAAAILFCVVFSFQAIADGIGDLNVTPTPGRTITTEDKAVLNRLALAWYKAIAMRDTEKLVSITYPHHQARLREMIASKGDINLVLPESPGSIEISAEDDMLGFPHATVLFTDTMIGTDFIKVGSRWWSVP